MHPTKSSPGQGEELVTVVTLSLLAVFLVFYLVFDKLGRHRGRHHNFAHEGNRHLGDYLGDDLFLRFTCINHLKNSQK